jgi:hypothetical protein
MILHVEADTLILDENRNRVFIAITNDNKPTLAEHEQAKELAKELVDRWNRVETFNAIKYDKNLLRQRIEEGVRNLHA